MSTVPSGPAQPSAPSSPAAAPGTTPEPSTGRTAARVVTLAVVLDVVSVLAFAAGGRASHAADSPLTAVAGIAWPFLAGLAVAWVVLRAWRRPLVPWPVGVGAWALTWAVGMALRAATGEGLAVPFLVVSALFLLATLVGWRLVASLVARLRAARTPR
ncbi:hypothetical protein JOE63_001839 [Cellulosimicrobium cellulans]|uniref:DUF3054 domain-containing protein n=1 Tax=Cellulosimicrobium cellulans TaxID=1710 RepID=A0A1Y0HWY1_CELCE|nr:DUF3054 domain-containing protein [Cellulosimicrobium cellulans]ARU52661.1 hypothetical protein CBR64_15600 [Cellulosimicrobium cellulans]MBM7819362.1 hypothetical protein [Cellulosimicrobium cellulans]